MREPSADPGPTGVPAVPVPDALPDGAGDLLLPAARVAIARAIGAGGAQAASSTAAPTPPWARGPGASFVTLTMHGRLRGCIGSLVARRPLLEDVRANAVAAATQDPRFTPLAPAELAAVAIEVSVLSAPHPLRASGLREACVALRPGVDGVIVTTGDGHRATFLPQVWQDLPDPAQFLAQLWLKAGVQPGVWHPGTTLSIYTVRAWHEAPPASRAR